MKPEAYSQYRESKIKILAAFPRTIQRGPASKNDPSAFIRHLVCRSCVGNQESIYVQVPECPVNEVIELTKVIDHVDGTHCSIIYFEIL
jgi:hypothetical protein